MRFSEVAARAARDGEFLRKIQAAADKAAADGVGSAAWVELAKYFAEDETELSLLTPSLNKIDAGQVDTNTTTTTLLTTQTGGITGTTTTTTTTSQLCTIPGICPPSAGAAPEAAARGGDKKTDKGRRR